MRLDQPQTFSSMLLISILFIIFCAVGIYLAVNNIVNVWIYGGVIVISYGLSGLIRKKLIIPAFPIFIVLTDKDAKPTSYGIIITGLVLIVLSYFNILS